MKKAMGLFCAVILALGCFGLAACANPSRVKVLDYLLTDEDYAFCVQKGNTALLNSVNNAMETLKENGKFNDILNKYFGDGAPAPFECSTSSTNRATEFVVVTNSAFAPFEYKEGNKFAGVDMEIARELASMLGKKLVIIDLPFDSVVTSVQQGLADIGMAGLTITDDRKEAVDFCASYYKASQVAIVRADDERFDGIHSAEDVVAKLKALGSVKIGFQSGTTGEYFSKGNNDYEGFEVSGAKCSPYDAAFYAAKDLSLGRLDVVMVDREPALRIEKSLNAEIKVEE